nr:hypothetical protein [Tanacetum cinerariifolium]
DVTRLQALVDRKKIMISEADIFAGLAQMGYEKPSTKLTFYKAFFSSQWKFLIHTLLQSLSAKRTSWNEFSTAMDSAGMLAARQPAEEGIAEEQVQADDAVDTAVQDNGAEFPTHIQQILDVCSALTRRVENLENDKAAQKLENSKLKARVKRLEKVNKVRMIDDLDKDEGIELVKDANIAESEGRHAAEQAKKQAEIYHLDLDHPSKVLSMQEDDSEVQEVVEVVTTAKLITDVVTTASQVSATSATISAAKPSIPTAALTVVVAYTRRRK